MDVVTTSLEALIQRAINPQNEKPDVAAIEAFCAVLGKESHGVQVASRLLATYMQSFIEKEALQALALLDTCMKRCGHTFHAEIGKFRFLNVMIKLISPKYLGNKTSPSVRQKILELLHAWARDYPKEVKIKETYEMLRKQGIIKDPVSPVQNISDCTNKSSRVKNSIFENEENTKFLQELLRSKDPLNLQLANKLIKSMVKNDEIRVQMNRQRNQELESVHANVKLLIEMLDSYDPEKSSNEDVELMKELYDSCERLKPTITRLAYESQNDEIIGEVIAANEELTKVFEKYTSIMILGQGRNHQPGLATNASTSLLDLFSPTDSTDESNKTNVEPAPIDMKSDMDVLNCIFSSLGTTPGSSLDPSSSNTQLTSAMPDTNIMHPVNVSCISKTKEIQTSATSLDSKAKALEDLNQLGESLLKQSLSQGTTGIAKNNFSNLSNSSKDASLGSNSASLTLLNSPSSSTFVERTLGNDLISAPVDPASTDDKNASSIRKEVKKPICDFGDLLNNDDDAMLDASSSPSSSQKVNSRPTSDNDEKRISVVEPSNTEGEIKPLTDIHVTIDSIKPGTIPPLTVIEEKNGISVVLHFAKGSPRPDVTVIVVTTMSKNPKPLSDYLFQAVVPKQCKCRLQPPSGTELPGHNPFLPPSAITQIMLIANPQKYPLSLKFMLSYTMDDETFTEMGQVDKLPTVD